jgi:tetratricopeptide (TPR) repeat protein
MLMGEAYDGLDRTDQAIREFQAAAPAPAQPNVHFGLGYLHWRKHGHPLAEPELGREIEIGASVAQAKAFLGDIRLRQKQHVQASGLLEETIRLNPSLRIAHLGLGILHTQQKEHEEAVQALKQAIRRDPSKRMLTSAWRQPIALWVCNRSPKPNSAKLTGYKRQSAKNSCTRFPVCRRLPKSRSRKAEKSKVARV